MPRDALRNAVASLHTELGRADKLDAESRALLVEAVRDITATLDRSASPAAGPALGDGIRDAVERFEGDHPELVRAVARVADALGAAGI